MAKRKSARTARKRAAIRSPFEAGIEGASGPSVAVHPLLRLQRQLGNAEVARMLARRRGDDESLVSGLDADRRDKQSGGSIEARDDGSALRTKTNGVSDAARPALLQREITKKLKAGSISLDASSQLFQGSKLLDTAKFAPGAQDAAFSSGLPQQDPNATFHGTIRTTITTNWKFKGVTGPDPLRGNGKLVVDAPFRIPKAKDDDDTAVKFKQPRVGKQESNGDGAALDPQPQVLADSDETGGSLTVSPRVTYQEQNALSGQVGFSPLGIGVSGQKQAQTTDTQALGESFTVTLNVSKPAPGPKPGPQPDPNKKDSPPKVLTHFKETVLFDVNKRVPSAEEVAVLKAWWNGESSDQLHSDTPMPNQEARDAVKSGKAFPKVLGRASRTGSREFNLVLSKDRADSVAQVLRQDDMMGGGARVTSFGAGLDDVTVPGEDPRVRAAVTVFDALVSEEPKVTGKQ